VIKKFFDCIHVNSGVEDNLGIKSEIKINEFMKTGKGIQ
jgi:phosphoribosylanthranilate isomerase